ncbi:MAG: CPBP family intramembrane metalloprotease [Phycisphaerae bacterium]|nr:CPBP family intramembrane metalloprotease [Phycisphaerae bacterium]
MGWIVGAATVPLAATPALAAQDATPAAGSSVASVVGWALLLAAPLVLAWLWKRDAIRPGSFARAGVRDPGPLPWWFWLVAAVCVFLTAGMAMAVTLVALTGGAGLHPADQGAPIDRAWSAVGGFGAAAVLGALLAARAHRIAPLAGLRITGRGMLIGAGALVVAAPVVYAAGRLSVWAYRALTQVEPERLAHDTLKEIVERPGEPAAWLLIAAVVVLAPIAEEIAFRGFLQTSILRLTRRPWVAIAGASAVFTLVHGLEPYAMATVFALSLCLGVAFERRKNLGVPIAMHAIFNAANVWLAIPGG